MRAVCFVKRLQFDVPGTVSRHSLAMGDVDNDGNNELAVGTAEGELYIFKGQILWQKITGLGMITSIVIGDIFNHGKNALIVISGDGWVHIYYFSQSVRPNWNTLQFKAADSENHDTVDQNASKLKTDNGAFNNNVDQSNLEVKIGPTKTDDTAPKMECVHVQRIPTNTKVALIADVDKDGANELIIGLTDRVVRSYRWSNNLELGSGKLMGLNKWECANQIGTVTLQDSADGTPTLLVAQPGGTFMRIKCNYGNCELEDDSSENNTESSTSNVDYQTLGISRMRNPNISTEIVGNLKPKDNKKIKPIYIAANTHVHKSNFEEEPVSERISSHNLDEKEPVGVDSVDGNLIGGNIVLGEFKPPKNDLIYPTSPVKYAEDNLFKKMEDLKIKDVTTDNLENSLNEESQLWSNSKSYAIATLDGTIMLVQDEVILWSMQVDHNISALYPLDVTGDGADEIIACTWDGQTYILDQERNSVRFQFEEPVRAFCAGSYSREPGTNTPCLVYNNFYNKIILYYDVSLPSMVVTALNPEESLSKRQCDQLKDILSPAANVTGDGGDDDDNDNDGNGNSNGGAQRDAQLRYLTDWLLYGCMHQEPDASESSASSTNEGGDGDGGDVDNDHDD
ncbi:KICSTOR complex protein ITFG2-like [Trichogramma pretiosum]|uniref:KICSTOR complex protein ITFG2-like n=1 Tax=Trichogramma pretiosum TaxID=7493 RepID=UPI0006C9DA33|nr:KICSTOR complex protein ITFG2-like [Trichogramma pretiosum]